MGTKTEKAYEALKEAILRCEIREGAFLSEPEMMKRYGIGRTPYREACNRLHHEGMLEVVPRRGFFVPKLSFQGVRELFEARIVLEGVIAELAAQRASEAELKEMQRLIRLTASSKAEPEVIIKTNIDFHLLLGRMSRNRELERLLTQLLERTKRLNFIDMAYSGYVSEDFKSDHNPIYEAIRNRDPSAARQAVVRDIGHAQSATMTTQPSMPATPKSGAAP